MFIALKTAATLTIGSLLISTGGVCPGLDVGRRSHLWGA